MATFTTDIDKSLASIRNRADHLRHTINKLENNLAWNTSITWPEILDQFTVISKQMENINEELPEMMQYFVCIPKNTTENSNDIPLLLRTKEDPDIEKIQEETLQEAKMNQDNIILHDNNINNRMDLLKKSIISYNEYCENIDDMYKDRFEPIMKEIRNKIINKSNQTKKSLLSKSYTYMETVCYAS